MPELRTMQQVTGGNIHMMSAVTGGNIHMMSIGNGTPVPVGGLPRGGETGDLLAKKSDADYMVEWITPANSVEQDNTRPITAAAVYTEIGNINALLATI